MTHKFFTNHNIDYYFNFDHIIEKRPSITLLPTDKYFCHAFPYLTKHFIIFLITNNYLRSNIYGKINWLFQTVNYVFTSCKYGIHLIEKTPASDNCSNIYLFPFHSSEANGGLNNGIQRNIYCF